MELGLTIMMADTAEREGGGRNKIKYMEIDNPNITELL